MMASSHSNSQSVHRNFYDNYEASQQAEQSNTNNNDNNAANKLQLLEYVRNNMIGADEALDLPFGLRPIIYCDHTASSKPLKFIEEYIQTEVLPLYANTHTNTTTTGLQTTLLRREARDIIARNCKTSRDDVVFFTDSGSTAAIQLFLHCLNLKQRISLQREKITVILGPYEHHAIILPFRELGCELIQISEDYSRGGPDLSQLETQLKFAQNHSNLIIGAFSAASNINGIVSDTAAVTALLHQYNAVALFDYATAAAYTEINMNPQNSENLAKDAIVLSGHKMIGGPASSGILIIKKKWLLNSVPNKPAGGTVFFVSPQHHRYLENFEEREEGGTPNIIAAIRTGLIFQLKEQISVQTIQQIEHNYLEQFLTYFSTSSNLILMGNSHAPRLAIFSFLVAVEGSGGLFLHANYVSTLLNDLFGIQSRAGCLCAGPYGQFCLGINQNTADLYEHSLIDKKEILRPGFTRINLHFTLPQSAVDYILASIDWISRHGYKLLPLYGFYIDSGEWKHRSRMTKFPSRRWLGSVSYKSGAMAWQTMKKTLHSGQNLADFLVEADKILQKALNSYQNTTVDQNNLLNESGRELRWFLLPSEALQIINTGSITRQNSKTNPVQPPIWLKNTENGTISCLIRAENSENPSNSSAALDLSALHGEPNRIVGDEGEMLEFNKDQSRSSEVQVKTVSSSCVACVPSTKTQPEVGSKRAAASNSSNSSATFTNPKKIKEENQSISKTIEAKQPISSTNGENSVEICKNCFHNHWDNDELAIVAKKTAGTLTKECVSCSCTHFIPRIKTNKREIDRVAKKLQSNVGRAILDYNMIREGDRILVGVSGGKDSLSLINILMRLKAKAPIKFEVGAVTVDPQTPEYDPSALKNYFAALGIPYFYESQPILDTAKSCMTGPKASICAFCARMKRGVLYNTLRRENYNVLALGQHADDLAESLFMSIMHNGLLRTMKANYTIAAGEIRVIRPLIYVRERLTREYATIADLPVINENW
jgi:selenocysteine lyase/cysteine desulfurase